jgi:hypothetical protein
MRVFTYKARLVLQGDLQNELIYKETHAATLASRIGQALMEITAHLRLGYATKWKLLMHLQIAIWI